MDKDEYIKRLLIELKYAEDSFSAILRSFNDKDKVFNYAWWGGKRIEDFLKEVDLDNFIEHQTGE